MRQTSFRARAFSLVGLTAAAALTLTACSGDGDEGGDGGGDSYKVGIAQFVQHPALDASAEGFKAAFEEAGIDVEFDEQNAQGEQATAVTMAESFANSDDDLVLSIATPAAQAAANSISDKPVLFTAVTDAVEAELVDSNEAPGGNVTGTSDAVPEEALQDQFDLITQMVPDAKKVGIIYSSGEVNSEVQVENATKVADDLGIEIVSKTVTTANDIAQTAEALGDVDAYYVPTDNMVVSGISALVQVAEDKQIPIVAAEAGTVEGGAVATTGIDYFALGKQTGEMAIKILESDDPAAAAGETPVEFASTLSNTVNPGAAERMGVEIPDEVLEGAETVGE